MHPFTLLANDDIINTMRKNFQGENNPRWKGGKVATQCAFCNTVLMLWPCRIKISNYCNNTCSQMGKHPSTQFTKGHKTWNTGKKTGIKPINGWTKGHSPWNKGLHVTLSKFKGKTYIEMYGEQKANEIKQKIGIKSLGRKIIRKPLSPESIRKMLIFRSPNKTEIFLDTILQKYFPNEWQFVGNGAIIIEGKNPDWVNINNKKLIIELFGKHWHTEDEVVARSNIFSKSGYKTLIIWNYELKNLDNIIQKIQQLQ